MKLSISIILLCAFFFCKLNAQQDTPTANDERIHFNFNKSIKSKNLTFEGSNYTFENGIDKKCLSLGGNSGFNQLTLDGLALDGKQNFTVQFWVKTTSNEPTVLFAQKQFPSKGIHDQKNAGWALYLSGGTFAWNIGSGKRRLNYERDNGQIMPLNDGEWHQLTMTFEKADREVRLYYDGQQQAVYKVGFDFENNHPLVIGSSPNSFDYDKELLPAIKEGAAQLQKLVDAFNQLPVADVTEGDFLNLIVDSKELYLKKIGRTTAETDSLREQELSSLDELVELKKESYDNPYTSSQNHNLTLLKPIYELYSLKNGVVHINEYFAKEYTKQEQLFPSQFSMDELQINSRALSGKEVWESFYQYKKIESIPLSERIDTLTVAVWNIWHGGIHFSMDKHGWDSRQQIAKILKETGADIILMQETYSSGDYIAAELGYQLATTADWDYRHQGSNISVLSRFPITAIQVPEKAEFMNVSAKLAISQTQEIYAMSNWYGMASFPIVYDFHKARFDKANETPILFGGDFNAVPHLDGGDSPASIKLVENGFTDAYRSLHLDVQTFPGFTHQWGERIDQLYYKGKGLKNISTEVVHTAFGGFPSDHFVIVGTFILSPN